jgi:hypothetical protein
LQRRAHGFAEEEGTREEAKEDGFAEEHMDLQRRRAHGFSLEEGIRPKEMV